jgi:hypothetical protein
MKLNLLKFENINSINKNKNKNKKYSSMGTFLHEKTFQCSFPQYRFSHVQEWSIFGRIVWVFMARTLISRRGGWRNNNWKVSPRACMQGLHVVVLFIVHVDFNVGGCSPHHLVLLHILTTTANHRHTRPRTGPAMFLVPWHLKSLFIVCIFDKVFDIWHTKTCTKKPHVDWHTHTLDFWHVVWLVKKKPHID